MFVMHFSIPDTQEFVDEVNRTTYTGFNIHINGGFHCCLRYKQLHNLNKQLKQTNPQIALPKFPPKRVLALTQDQLEERRILLERYIQLVGQDPIFSKSELLRVFLLNAQQESSETEARETCLDVHLMNGFCINVTCFTTECSSRILEKACKQIDLPVEYVYYFSLYLMRKEDSGEVILTRRLMDFEAPFISRRIASNCEIVIRKSYWDPCYDQRLIQDKVALHLLYILTLSDIEQGWIITTSDCREQLDSLQGCGKKREYLELASHLPSYGCLRFANALVDYPNLNEPAHIVIGKKELCIQTRIGEKIQDTKFKITRMKCWRVTTNYNNECMNDAVDFNGQTLHLSFEYFMGKDCFQWITIISEQAMLMSVCLQSMVDELLNQKDGNDLNNIQIRQNCTIPVSYIRRDGRQDRRLSESSSTDTISSLNEPDMPLQLCHEPLSIKKRSSEKISTTVFFRNGKDSVHNEAFEEIGDDDL